MKAPLSYVPALPAAAGIVAGIIGSEYGVGVAAAIVGFVGFALLFAARRHYVSMFFLFGALGALLPIAHKAQGLPSEAMAKNQFTAEIVRTDEKSTSISYIAKIRTIGGTSVTPFKVQLTVRSVASICYPGSIIRFTTTFTPTDTKPEEGGETDYDAYLAAEGIAGRAMLSTAPQLLERPGGWRAAVNRVRVGIYNSIIDAPISGATASFLVAAMLGDKTLLGQETVDEFKDVGVAHILALSGMHVGVLASMLTLLLLPLSVHRHGRRVRSLLMLMLIWVYAVIVGMGPSIVRAATMLSVFILANQLQRGYSTYNSLLLSIVIILVINPHWLMTPGFQLSVLAVASVLVVSGAIPTALRRHPVAYFAVSVTVIPVAAMLGTGMVSAYYFNIMPGLFLPGNIIVGLIFPWLLGSGAVLTALTAAGISFGLLGHVADLLYTLMDTTIEYFAGIGMSAHAIYFSAWVFVPYFITMVILGFALYQRRRYQAILVIVGIFATATVYMLTTDRYYDSELIVGRAGSTTQVMLRHADKAWLLTDAKGATRETVAAQQSARHRRYLLSRGCSERLTLVADSIKSGPLYADNERIIAGDKVIAIVGKEPSARQCGTRCDYVLVTGDYRGSIPALRTELRADTVLLSAAIHHWRKKRMIRECSDTIPYRDIREQGFRLHID